MACPLHLLQDMIRSIAMGAVFAVGCTADVPLSSGMPMGGADAPTGTNPTGTPIDSILAGAFAPMAGYGQLTASGRALAVRGTGATTTVQIHVDGLTPATGYTAHVHALPCSAAAGGHYL